MTEDYMSDEAFVSLFNSLIVVWLVVVLLAIASTVACCIITYKLAEKKGKNGGLWLVLSLFIGWIATIIVACLDPEPDFNNPNFYANNNYYPPYNPYPPYPYAPPVAPPPTTDTTQTAQETQTETVLATWKCDCGSENNANHKFCAYCGKEKSN